MLAIWIEGLVPAKHLAVRLEPAVYRSQVWAFYRLSYPSRSHISSYVSPMLDWEKSYDVDLRQCSEADRKDGLSPLHFTSKCEQGYSETGSAISMQG